MPGSQRQLNDPDHWIPQKRVESISTAGWLPVRQGHIVHHGFMRDGDDPIGKGENKKARDEAWGRWKELLKKL